MNLFKNLVLFVLSVQEKLLAKNLQKTLNVKPTSKRKKVFGEGYFLSLETIAESEKKKMEEELSLILKVAEYNPEKILDYVRLHDTMVCYIENPKMLYSIGENEGFIYPQKGFKALYLSQLVSRKFAFKTPEMFILSKGEINRYYFIYHFYNWYAFKHGILGLDAESQNLLKKYLFNSSEEELNKLQLSDIYKLKDAIKQDKSAIEFVFKLCQQCEGAKKAFQKIQDSGASL